MKNENTTLKVLPVKFQHRPDTTKPCAKCQGRGAHVHSPWLTVQCDNCYGSGYVSKSRDDNHFHEWKFEANLGRSYNRYVCACGAHKDIDSGD